MTRHGLQIWFWASLLLAIPAFALAVILEAGMFWGAAFSGGRVPMAWLLFQMLVVFGLPASVILGPHMALSAFDGGDPARARRWLWSPLLMLGVIFAVARAGPAIFS